MVYQSKDFLYIRIQELPKLVIGIDGGTKAHSTKIYNSKFKIIELKISVDHRLQPEPGSNKMFQNNVFSDSNQRPFPVFIPFSCMMWFHLFETLSTLNIFVVFISLYFFIDVFTSHNICTMNFYFIM
jgi:hypothetical protein